MCGITGIVGISRVDILQSMLSSMVHRGPDDKGSYVSDDVALGMRRLSIIDPSPLGHQPMANEDGTIWIVYNGEIYNYEEINARLQGQGHRIKSNCDTESIIHLYEDLGEDCVHRLRGMFSFAIWNRASRTLFAARDRLGIKPFYYSVLGDRLVFASELKTIMASGLVPRIINPLAVWHYLSLGAIPSPLTIWKDVWALGPGHRLTYRHGRTSVQQYWDVQQKAVSPPQSSLARDEVVPEMRRLLEDAVRLHMRSDVPIGAFLSGGIDSSAIVGLMNRFTNRPVRTFSVGYDVGGDGFDERREALIAARHFQTDHQDIVVSGQDVLGSLDKMIWHMDQPSHDGINSYVISQAAAKSVKVALSGLGGDEIFGGYSTFKFAGLLAQLSPITKTMPSWVNRAGTRLEQALPVRHRPQWPVRVAAGIVGAYDSVAKQFAAIRFFFSDVEKQSLLTPEYTAGFMTSDPSGSSNSLLIEGIACGLVDADIFNQMSYLELRHYMGDVLLRDSDVMSMAHSLELRVPLVDHALVEFAMSLPGKLKSGGLGNSKFLLKECVKDLVPMELLNRHKKGFAFPMTIWLKQPGFREIIEECLSERSIQNRGIFDPSGIQVLKRDFYQRAQFGNCSKTWLRVWIPTVLELWCRANLDSSSPGVEV